MAEKLTMKRLAEELDALSKQLAKLEMRFERKLEGTLEKATEKLRARLERAEGQRGPAIDAETRRRLIEQCAYLRAESRGFAGGDPTDDWLQAEMQVDHLLLRSLTSDEFAADEGEAAREP